MTTREMKIRKIVHLARQCSRSESSASVLIKRAIWILDNDSCIECAHDAVSEAAEQLCAERDEG
jgi:hypothetical protein